MEVESGGAGEQLARSPGADGLRPLDCNVSMAERCSERGPCCREGRAELSFGTTVPRPSFNRWDEDRAGCTQGGRRSAYQQHDGKTEGIVEGILSCGPVSGTPRFRGEAAAGRWEECAPIGGGPRSAAPGGRGGWG